MNAKSKRDWISRDHKPSGGKIRANHISAGRDVVIVSGTYIDKRTPETKIISENAAFQKLNDLPINDADPIPDYNNLPTGSRMDIGPYLYFSGRENEIRKIASILKAEGRKIALEKIVIITGLGGIGKSQIAAEFVHRYGQFFLGGVFWINFEDESEIENEIALCGGSAGLSISDDFEELKISEKIDLVKRKWREPIPRLLIFDNCNDTKLIRKWKPITGSCRILVTSQINNWDPNLGFEEIPIDIFLPLESNAYLKKLAPHINNKEASEICEELGHFPLALSLAGSFLHLSKNEISPKEYIKEIRNAAITHPSLSGFKSDFSPTGHELNVMKTFSITLSRLNAEKRVDALAIELSNNISWLSASTPIYINILYISIEKFLASNKYSYKDFIKSLNRLDSLGIIRINESKFVIHRLLHNYLENIRKSKTSFTNVQDSLICEFEKQLNKGVSESLRLFINHIIKIAEISIDNSDSISKKYLENIIIYFYKDGALIKALDFAEKSVRFCRNLFGENNLETATALNDLAMVNQELGFYDKALQLHKESILIRKRFYGENHPNLSMAYNNIGILYRSLGKYQDSKEFFEKALTIRKNVYGEEDKHTIITTNNLAALMNSIGKYSDALSLYSKVLKVYEKILDNDDPVIARTKNNLAIVYDLMAEYEIAEELHIEALNIRINKLNENHPDIAQSFHNLGHHKWLIWDFDSSRLFYEKALIIRKAVFGKSHPDVINTYNGLGKVFYSLGYFNKSFNYLQKALNLIETSSNEVIPIYGLIKNNLSEVYIKINDFNSALKLANDSINYFNSLVGKNHPNTALAMNTLAKVYLKINKLATSFDTANEALQINKTIFGENHPHTIQSLYIIAQIYFENGDFQNSFKNLLIVQDFYLNKFGNKHRSYIDISNEITKFHFT